MSTNIKVKEFSLTIIQETYIIIITSKIETEQLCIAKSLTINQTIITPIYFSVIAIKSA